MTHQWSDAHSTDPAPSAALGLLQEFVNTNDIEEGRDAIGTPEELATWLAEKQLVPPGTPASAAEHARAMAIREGLRALGRVNNEEALEPGRIEAMNAAAGRLPLHATVAGAAAWTLAPASGGVDGFLERLMGTLIGAMADGSWSRMKSCRNDTCRWLFFDQSRNRSGTWCSMAVCGSRAKARAYRARRREEAVAV